MALYEKIREENKGFYETKYKNTTSLVINKYNDRTHFIFELIQNAEDSGAENVLFSLCSDCLIIIYLHLAD